MAQGGTTNLGPSRQSYFFRTMADDDEPTFDMGDSGASHTYPQQAGEIKKGSHLMIKGHPCKCVEVSTSKTGKHGHAKAHIGALDIFTEKKYEDLCPTSHNLEVPFVTRTEFQALNIEDDGVHVSLLVSPETGDIRNDIKLPNQVTEGSATEADEKTTKELIEALDEGSKDVIVVVLKACGMEKIISVKTQEAK